MEYSIAFQLSRFSPNTLLRSAFYRAYKRIPLYLFIFLIVQILTSCGEKRSNMEEGKQEYSALLRITDHKGYTVAEIVNPWDTTHLLQRLILTEDLSQESLPEGVKVQIPIRRAMVATTVHCSLLKELGRLEVIKAVCDKEYISVPEILSGIEQGEITDCGPATSPIIEKVITVRPEAILLSPYEKVDLGKLDALGIPVILCADYMESSPLARAEWVKLYGILFGVREESEKFFRATADEYLRLKRLASTVTSRPRILSDHAYGQTWYQPSSESTVGKMYSDAGGENPFGEITGYYGSIPLSTEEVFLRARDCDFWLLKDDKPITRASLSSENKLYNLFKAYKNNGIWTCKTRETMFYEETPFHPDRLLADMIRIFHPELNIGGENRYFKICKE